MKVILRVDIGGVGKRDDVKDVSDGYALNSLIPQGKVYQATPQRLLELKNRVEAQKKAHADVKDKWATLAKRLQNITVLVTAKANEQHHLYRAITEQEIADAIHKTIVAEVPAEAIHILGAIRTLGMHPFQIKLGEHLIRANVNIKAHP